MKEKLAVSFLISYNNNRSKEKNLLKKVVYNMAAPTKNNFSLPSKYRF